MMRLILALIALTLSPLAATAEALCTGATECRSDGTCNRNDTIPMFQVTRAGNGLTLAWNSGGVSLKDQLQAEIDKRTGKVTAPPGGGWNGAGRTVAMASLGGPSFTGFDGQTRETLLLTLNRGGAFVLTGHGTRGRPAATTITGTCEGQP